MKIKNLLLALFSISILVFGTGCDDDPEEELPEVIVYPMFGDNPTGRFEIVNYWTSYIGTHSVYIGNELSFYEDSLMTWENPGNGNIKNWKWWFGEEPGLYGNDSLFIQENEQSLLHKFSVFTSENDGVTNMNFIIYFEEEFYDQIVIDLKRKEDW